MFHLDTARDDSNPGFIMDNTSASEEPKRAANPNVPDLPPYLRDKFEWVRGANGQFRLVGASTLINDMAYAASLWAPVLPEDSFSKEERKEIYESAKRIAESQQEILVELDAHDNSSWESSRHIRNVGNEVGYNVCSAIYWTMELSGLVQRESKAGRDPEAANGFTWLADALRKALISAYKHAIVFNDIRRPAPPKELGGEGRSNPKYTPDLDYLAAARNFCNLQAYNQQKRLTTQTEAQRNAVSSKAAMAVVPTAGILASIMDAQKKAEARADATAEEREDEVNF